MPLRISTDSLWPEQHMVMTTDHKMKFALWTVFLCVLGVKGREVCYHDIGCFTDEEPWSGTLERKIPDLPASPEHINVQFFLYTKDNPDKPQLVHPFRPSTVSESSFKFTRRSRFIIHGYLVSGKSKWEKDMCQAMLQVEDVNCFIVDWSGGSHTIYSQAANNVRVVGAVMAHFIDTLVSNFSYSPSLVHVIGHSLGAHAAGEVGKRRSGIARITGLDPAEPYFQYTPPEVRLDPTDADFVDVIHTDSSSILSHLGLKGYGMSQMVGHLDFFPNGGESMPGCQWFSAQSFDDPDYIMEGGPITCNHLRSYKYYTDSILSPDGFLGYAADSYEAFALGVGFPCPIDGCPVMGHYADTYKGVLQRNQTYYLNTGPEHSYLRWRYHITVHIVGVGGKSGHFDVALLGFSGTSEKYQIYKGYIRAGETYGAFINSESDVGSVMQVKFYWDSSPKGFYPQNITVQSGKDGQIFAFCGSQLNKHKIQTIETCNKIK